MFTGLAASVHASIFNTLCQTYFWLNQHMILFCIIHVFGKFLFDYLSFTSTNFNIDFNKFFIVFHYFNKFFTELDQFGPNFTPQTTSTFLFFLLTSREMLEDSININNLSCNPVAPRFKFVKTSENCYFGPICKMGVIMGHTQNEKQIFLKKYQKQTDHQLPEMSYFIKISYFLAELKKGHFQWKQLWEYTPPFGCYNVEIVGDCMPEDCCCMKLEVVYNITTEFYLTHSCQLILIFLQETRPEEPPLAMRS